MTTIELKERNRKAQAKRRSSERAKEVDRQYMRTRRQNQTFVTQENDKQKKRWRDKASWPAVALCNIRARCKKTGLECSIDVSDIPVPEICPVLGIPLVSGIGHGIRNNPNSPSVDRIDNSKGYIKGNVKVISMRANVLKSNATVEELESIINYIKENSYHYHCFSPTK